jgi:NADH-quinone oxidoreductase subunit M
VFAALGVILGAVYMLHMVARVVFGPLKVPAGREDACSLPEDIGRREIGILVPIAIAVVVLGVVPGKLLDSLYEPVKQMIGKVEAPAQSAVAGRPWYVE